MRAMGRHFLLHGALGLALAMLLGSGAALAGSREVPGETLVLTDARSADTVISTDPSLSGHIRVSLDGTVSCLSVTGGETAVVSTSGCPEDGGTLRIDVPPSMPLTVTGNGDGNIHFSDTDAPLIVSMNGSGNVIGGRVGHLVLSVHGSSDVSFGAVQGGGAILEMTGSGDVRLASVVGALVLKHHSSGDLAVGHIDAAVVQVESTGSGDMLFGAGNVGTLSVHMQGDGDLAVAAPVHDADISAYGGGDVKLGVVTGTMHRSSGDGSDVIVGGPAVVDTVIGKVAHAIGTGDDHTVRHSGSGGGHFLTLLAVAVLAFIVWRMVRRGAFRATPPAPSVMHPGVAAVTETLRRVEERLGRVEGYVTSREFDLQQKFRKL
jgi:hypothetical protein